MRWSYAKEMRAELDRDIGALCAEQHKREAKMVAALKLQSVWEPAPFPVEVPKASRAAQCDDAPFSPVPWPAPPDGLFADQPDGIGDLRFSDERLERRGRATLLVPLLREEAQRRHAARENYRLTVHPAEGQVLVIHYRGRRPKSPYQNQDLAYLFLLHIDLARTTPDWRVDAQFWADPDTHGLVRDIRVEVFDGRSGVDVWRSDLDARKGLRTDRDERNGTGSVEVAVSEEEMAPYLGTDFGFGDYRSLLQTADTYTRWAGFGPLPIT